MSKANPKPATPKPAPAIPRGIAVSRVAGWLGMSRQRVNRLKLDKRLTVTVADNVATVLVTRDDGIQRTIVNLGIDKVVNSDTI